MKKITRKGWIATNRDNVTYDIENMSYYKTKKEAVKCWGKRQVILPITIIFNK